MYREKVGSMKTLGQHNREFEKPIFEKSERKNGIACDVCGEELYDSDTNTQLLSYPPKYEVHCKKCGFKGTRY